ncbi:Phosphatidylinositol 4-kinase pik1alpha (PI4-kinase)(PtdIns-4-kinase), partial [Rhizopus stolonifer]
CLWYLQAYLSDLSANPNHPSFQLCKRVFNRCQTIIFTDSSHEEQDDVIANGGLDRTQRVRENPLPALVGMGALLAGIGQPAVTKPVGSVAIAQGRKARLQTFNSSDASVVSRRNTFEGDDVLHRSHSQPNLSIKPVRPHSISSAFSTVLGDKDHFTVSLEDLHKGKAFSVSRYLKQAQQKIQRKVRSTLVTHEDTMPPLQLLDQGGMNMKAMAQSSVPLAQEPTTPTTLVSPSRSFSSEEAFGQFSPKRMSMDVLPVEDDDLVHDSGDSDDDEVYALAKLSLDDRRQLLRSNYFRSEMQFLLALVDIATRLVIVPKPARL